MCRGQGCEIGRFIFRLMNQLADQRVIFWSFNRLPFNIHMLYEKNHSLVRLPHFFHEVHFWKSGRSSKPRPASKWQCQELGNMSRTFWKLPGEYWLIEILMGQTLSISRSSVGRPSLGIHLLFLNIFSFKERESKWNKPAVVVHHRPVEFYLVGRRSLSVSTSQTSKVDVKTFLFF